MASLQLALGFSAALDRSGVSALAEAVVGAETAAAGEALQVAEEGEEGEEEAALPRGPGPLVALRDSDGGHYVLHRAVLAGRSLDLALLSRVNPNPLNP